jgi:hypothetical protein
MGYQELWTEIRRLRGDLSAFAIHFTRTRTNSDDFDLDWPPAPPTPAVEVLAEILNGNQLKGGTRGIRGGYRCVCFTETPLRFVYPLIPHVEGRYEPYGIAVRKKWLFDCGGRPVIYQPEDEMQYLDPAIRFRHAKYQPRVDEAVWEPGSADFTWEREWRVQTDSLAIDKGTVIALVPTEAEKQLLIPLLADPAWDIRCIEEVIARQANRT